jgi:hypothetical protein
MRTLIPLLTCVLLTVFSLAAPCFAKYSGGTGEHNDPFLISTPEDLNSVGADPCDWDKHFLLTNDIDMTAYTYTTALIAPDTSSDWDFQGTKFTGVFDGAGFKVINLTIDTTGIGNGYLGLFGYMHLPAELKNLGVEDVNITGGDDSYYLGGLAGVNSGTISDCFSTGSVTGDDLLGGLVGYNVYGVISDCFSTGSVTGGDNSYHLGGLVGENSGEISNCSSTSQVTGGDHSFILGGLCGLNSSGIISNCFSTGSVTSGSGSGSLGGLVGLNELGTISNCFSTGQVTGRDHPLILVGGLVGANFGTISNCYSIGQVTGGDHSLILGGLCGLNPGTISNCYSIGQVTGGDYSDYLGGLVGGNPGTISDCYATGQVTGWSNSDYLGGLVGANSGTISNCFWDIETGGPDNGIGTGLPTALMQTKSTFTDAGWDFTTPVWKICETADYPRLAWQKIPAPILNPEPDITTGAENTITWQDVNEAVEYYAVCCNDPNLEEPILDSGWLDTNEVTFAGLDTGRTYYYAVKARQNCVMESDFSNIESSMQGTLGDAVDLMLDPNSLKNANMANALSNKIDEVLAMIDTGNYQAALKKLENDILAKTDGCANSGQPDKNDWNIS